MPGRLFADRLAAARARVVQDQKDQDDAAAAAERLKIVRAANNKPSWYEQYNPTSWLKEHSPFDVEAAKADLSDLGNKVSHPGEWLADSLRADQARDAALRKATNDRINNSSALQFVKGIGDPAIAAAKGAYGLGEAAYDIAPHVWSALKPGATYEEKQNVRDMVTAGGEGMDEGVKSLFHKPWRAVDPGIEAASEVKDPARRYGNYAGVALMTALGTKTGRAGLGKAASGVERGAYGLSEAMQSGIENTGSVVSDIYKAGQKLTTPKPFPMKGQFSSVRRALPAVGETSVSTNASPFVSHPGIGVAEPTNPILGVAERQDGRTRFSIRGQKPAPPFPGIQSPYLQNLLPEQGSPSRVFPERIFTSHPDLGISLPQEPPLGVVEKFTPQPVSAGMGRTPAAQRSAATSAFEALVPDRYKTQMTPENVTMNRLGDVTEGPRKGLRTLTPTGLKNPTTTTSLAEMVDMYGLDEAAARAQMTPREVTEYLASRPAPPKAVPGIHQPTAPPKLADIQVLPTEAPPVAPPKKMKAPKAQKAPAPAPPAAEAPKARMFEKSPVKTLEALAKRGNKFAVEELKFRKANPQLQPKRAPNETGAIGMDINRPWGEIDTSNLDERLQEVTKAIEEARGEKFRNPASTPQERARIDRERQSLEMIRAVLDEHSGDLQDPGRSFLNHNYLYGEDPSAPGGISSAIAGHMTKNAAGDPSLYIQNLGSIIPGEGKKLMDGLSKWATEKGALEASGSPLVTAENFYRRSGGGPKATGRGWKMPLGDIDAMPREEVYAPHPSQMQPKVAERMERYKAPKPVLTEEQQANQAALRDIERHRASTEGDLGLDEDYQDWIHSLDPETQRAYQGSVPDDVREALDREPDVVGERDYRNGLIHRYEALEADGSISRGDQQRLDDWRAISQHEERAARQNLVVERAQAAREARRDLEGQKERSASAQTRAVEGDTRTPASSGPMDPELERRMRELGVDVDLVRTSPYLRESWERPWQREGPAFFENMNPPGRRNLATDEGGFIKLPSKAQVKKGARTTLDAANQLRIASMLSGWALPKSLLGNVGSSITASVENLAAGKGKASFAPIREAMNLPANAREFKAGWKSGANPAIAGATNFGKYNPITRTMGAADQMSTKMLERAGLTEAEAKRILLTDPQWGLKGKTSPVLDYLVPFRRTPFNVLQGGAKTMADHPLLSLGAGATGAGIGSMSDDPRVLGLSGALFGPYTLPFLIGGGMTAGARALQGISPMPEWSMQESIGDPLRPFAEPAFFRMFSKGGQEKKSAQEKRATRTAPKRPSR